MNGKEGNYLQRKTYNVEIIYIPIFELFIYIFFLLFRAAEEEARRNAAKAFNDRCANLEVTLSEFEKHIIKVWFKDMYLLIYLFFSCTYLILDL